VRDLKGPMLLHVQTMKGKGYQIAELDPRKYHGVKGISPGSGKVEAPKSHLAYTDVFGEGVVRLAREDPRVNAVTAAMVDGTGLVRFARELPERFFDVGIAEAHAVTFCAGMAVEGQRPVVAIYSTFLQRAFDQIIHDIALQHLPVVFCLDRAGLVGEDGPTHHGAFDLSYLGCVPGLVLAAPSTGTEMMGMLRCALAWTEGPFAIRYPRDLVPEEEMPDFPDPIEVGTWVTLRPPDAVTFLAVGSMVPVALEAADLLAAVGLPAGVLNCRFVRPLDAVMLASLTGADRKIVTIEENSLAGGFGSQVGRWYDERSGSARPQILSLGLPDSFVEHGSRGKLLELCGLTASQVAERVRAFAQGTAPEAGSASRRVAADTNERR
jgi:1-deoxy-D-xylulose-5-phosphate synthase